MALGNLPITGLKLTDVKTHLESADAGITTTSLKDAIDNDALVGGYDPTYASVPYNSLKDFRNYKYPSVILGLTPALISVPAQNLATWTQRSADVSAYVGSTVRLVIKYTQGSSYTGDVQVDNMVVGGLSYDAQVGTNSFQKSSTSGKVTAYTSVTWNSLTTATSGNGLWLRDSGGTGSGGTGNTAGVGGQFYYYAETSGSFPTSAGNIFWLRSPTSVLASNNFSLYTAQNGATCGAIEVYLEIVA